MARLESPARGSGVRTPRRGDVEAARSAGGSQGVNII